MYGEVDWNGTGWLECVLMNLEIDKNSSNDALLFVFLGFSVECRTQQNCTVRFGYFQTWAFLNKAHVKVILGYFKNCGHSLILIVFMGQLHSVTVETKVWQDTVLIYPYLGLDSHKYWIEGCVCECLSPCNYSVTFLLPISWLRMPSLLSSPRVVSNMNNLVSVFHTTIGYLPAGTLGGYSHFLVQATWRELK